jgi:hypothetical protein
VSRFQILDTVLSQSVRMNPDYTVLGRSFFHNYGQVISVGNGKEVTVTAARPGGLFLGCINRKKPCKISGLKIDQISF